MKLVPVLLLVFITACCRDGLTQRHFWNQKQFMAGIDQDANRQDTWIRKQISDDTFLVMDRSGKYLKRK
jgi:hypothetical protein